jgi:hypothetical protein
MRRALGIGLGLFACGEAGAGSEGQAESSSGENGAEASTSAPIDDSSSAATTDAPPPTSATSSDDDGGESSSESGTTSERVPIFVAQGMVGRSTISCDDGHTWVADRSWDLEGDPHLCGATDPVVCFAEGSTCSQQWYDGTCSEGPCDCGHSPGFAKGIAYGGGRFVATWGWGWPGAVATSTNGIDWTTTLDNDSFGGLRFGGDRFVVASRTPQISLDGTTWMPSEEADFQNAAGEILWSVRRFGWSDFDGGRFVAYASGDGIDVLVSSDGGISWWRPSSLPADCLGEGPGAYGDILGGNGITLMVDGDGHACRSLDGGDTWTSSVITDSRIASSGIWTGEEFWFWGWGNRYSSADGVEWTTTPVVADADIGPVARSPSGTLVAVNNVWLGYADQRFLRSEDGLVWETLAEGAFTAGHPIFFIEHGEADPSDACPG